MNLKKIYHALMSRLSVVTCLIALQFLILILIFTFLSSISRYALILFKVISVCAVIWIVSNHDNPSYKMVWIITIMLFPIIGGIFYLMFGNKKLSPRFRSRISSFFTSTLTHIPQNKSIEDRLSAISPHLATQAKYVQNASGYSLWENTAVDYYNVGEEFFEGLITELKSAKKFIFMEYFIIQPGEMWNQIFDILSEKVIEGVEVYLMYDDMGCIKTLPHGFDDMLKSRGIKVNAFNAYKPHLNMAMNYRDHRKICVVDGNVGFCGGINLADEYINRRRRYGHWKDTAVMLRGDAVWNLTVMFLTIWKFSTGENFDFKKYLPTEKAENDGFIQPFGDSPLDNANIVENIYLHIINRADKYIYITTPYLIIDNEMLTALCTAAESGVDVRIVTPHIADKWYVHLVTQAHYRQLIEAGVHIYEYTPGFVHAKMFVCDDDVAVVGTANMDYRSLYLHFECGILFYKSSIIKKVKHDIVTTLDICKKITLMEVCDVPLYKRILRGAIRILAPLM